MASSEAMKDRGGEALRRLVAEVPSEAAAARTELERRRSNLKGAVIPAWERKRRGDDYTRWKVA